MSSNNRNKVDFKRIINSGAPLLSEILNSKLRPTEIHFDFDLTRTKKQKTSNNENNPFQNHADFAPSELTMSFDEFVPIEPVFTREQELIGRDNSLFLAISRFILYKCDYEKKFCPYIFKNFYVSDINRLMNSDVYLQEVLREKLCCFWLANLKKRNFSRYAK